MQPSKKSIVLRETTITKTMIQRILLLAFLLVSSLSWAQDQDDADYIEFNDRKNVVHGVYLGLTTYFGEIDGKDTYIGGLKVAYVANRKFEVGFVGNFLYSEQDNPRTINEDLIAAYGGLHIEPILFSESMVNLSFPVLIGAGGVGYFGNNFDDPIDDNIDEDEIDAIFVFEPGMSVLFNVSRYVQLEAGIKYRFSNKLDLDLNPLDRINGFSGGFGVKIGVFNMGRNRYKKHLDDEQ
ncbi:hypothetical protein [Flagellimonas algicola]|uniref:Outer membrane protein beta-barrel domain-containing protein n=1 Tax=Flagellimonas algicola TaxID=2583815 RepID=A0ABY2WJI0_9FLAO|nr:hypothetical protein [Allomuricauda algicola]TMU54666.1 hypothetical protein FGG15_10705 [Allomuricauda algicola]